MGTTALVIGATGFVGNSLLAALGRTYARAIGLCSAQVNLCHPEGPGKLRRLVDEETVILCAARSRDRDPFRAATADIGMARAVAEVIATAKPKKCLYLSSLAVYGDAASNYEISEQTPPAPTTPYGLAKIAAEGLIEAASRSSRTPLVIFRPCKIYGPGEASNAYGPTQFVKAIIAGENIHLYGDGSELRDHLYVCDLVELIVRALEPAITGTFTLGSGESHSFLEIVQMIETLTGRAAVISHQPRSRPRIDQKIDVNKTLEAFHGFRFTPLGAGLAALLRKTGATREDAAQWQK